MMSYTRLTPFARQTLLGSVVFSVVLSIFGGKASAQTPLPPGTTTSIPIPLVVSGSPPFGGTLLQELQSPVFGTNTTPTDPGNTISGTISSAVFRNSSGFLDFAYQFSFDNNTNIIIDQFSISSFSNVQGVRIAQTGEDIDGAGLAAQSLGGTIQNFFVPGTVVTSIPVRDGSLFAANRPNPNGDGINGSLAFGVKGNESSYTFFVRTQETDFTVGGSASVQGGGISAFTTTQSAIVPVGTFSAPEPGTLTLLGLGLLAPFAQRARRK